MDRSPHRSDYVDTNGIRLHYLDWGGEGETLLFLAGLGCNAHIFDQFAPRFVDRFRVLALTRRGHGESDHPAAGYDIDSLAEDIRQFLDALQIERVILTGHSLAGIELARFGALYPERVAKLVHLDSAYNRTSETFKRMMEENPLPKFQPPGLEEDYYSPEDYFRSLRRAYPALDVIWGEIIEEQGRHEIEIDPDGKVVDKLTDGISAAITETVNGYVPEDWKIRAPVLSFYAQLHGPNYVAKWMTEDQVAQVLEYFEHVRPTFMDEIAAEFQRNVPHAQIVMIPNGHHYCFMTHDALVYEAMRRFLLA